MEHNDWDFDPDDRPRPVIVLDEPDLTPAAVPTGRPTYDDFRAAADAVLAAPGRAALAGWFRVFAGGRCRWVRTVGAWYVLHGRRWSRDGGTVERMAKDSVWRLAAFSGVYPPAERATLLDEAGRLLRLGVLRAVVEHARGLLAVADVDDLPAIGAGEGS